MYVSKAIYYFHQVVVYSYPQIFETERLSYDNNLGQSNERKISSHRVI
jgi:hypothetical protein